jgi:molecular chaperone DnaK
MAGVDRASVKVTRDEFEAATNDLLEQTIDFTRTTVDKAAAAGSETIDRVLLVGGSSFMPAVSRRLQEAFSDWVPELQDPNQAVAKGAALAGLQAALRSMIASGGGDPDGAPTDQRIKQIAEMAGISRSTAQAVLETEVTNVCSRGFGIKAVREGRDPNSEDPVDYEVVHIIEPNTPLPVLGTEPERVRTFFTVVDNQSGVHICLMEQQSRELTGDMSGNRQIEEGDFEMTRAYPRRTPIQIALGMQNNGVLHLKAIDQDGREMEFDATTQGAVMSEERLAVSMSKVRAMQRA